MKLPLLRRSAFTTLAPTLLSALVAALCLAPAGPLRAQPATPAASGIDKAHFDGSVRPQDDLYLSANGRWLKDTPIPADKAAYGINNELAGPLGRWQGVVDTPFVAYVDADAKEPGINRTALWQSGLGLSDRDDYLHARLLDAHAKVLPQAFREAFDRLTGQLTKQFNAYQPLPGQHLNGKLTLGENIADLSGLEIAYKAWQLSLGGKPAPVIDGFTGEQRFFYAYAQSWRDKQREALTRQLLSTDPHAPSEFRANGSVMNVDAFHQTVGTQPGDRLYKAPAARIRIC